jgi:hypothetical protein
MKTYKNTKYLKWDLNKGLLEINFNCITIIVDKHAIITHYSMSGYSGYAVNFISLPSKIARQLQRYLKDEGKDLKKCGIFKIDFATGIQKQKEQNDKKEYERLKKKYENN